ncbi:unnamed protein product [Rotaria sp. Silwood2]|nr:unnamed protein product [Rotaria sp. Silwood2]
MNSDNNTLPLTVNIYAYMVLFDLTENCYLNSYNILETLIKDNVLDINNNLTQIITIMYLERPLILAHSSKNDICRVNKHSRTIIRQLIILF